MSIAIRRIAPADWARQRELRLEMLADTPIAYAELLGHAQTRPDSWWRERAQHNSAGPDSALFFAEAGGELTGQAAGYADGPGRTCVVGVYVRPEWRGHGIIDQLITAVADWSASQGRNLLVLEVAEQNPRARRAYTRLGFVLTGNSRPHPLFPDMTELEMQRRAQRGGRRLGIDVGSVRVGVAVSDPDGLLATPVETVARGKGSPDLARIAAIAEEYDVAEVIVGLPRTLRGERGKAADLAIAYADRLRELLKPVPVQHFDERFSTVTASRALRDSGVRAKSQRQVIDQAAAVAILQGWLDQHRSTGTDQGSGSANMGTAQ